MSLILWNLRPHNEFQKRETQRVRFENEEPRNLKRCHNCKVWINSDGTYADKLPTTKGEIQHVIIDYMLFQVEQSS